MEITSKMNFKPSKKFIFAFASDKLTISTVFFFLHFTSALDNEKANWAPAFKKNNNPPVNSIRYSTF